MKLAAVLVMVSACGGCAEWAGWGKPAEVTPVGPPEWGAWVEQEIGRWNLELEARGCTPPFYLGPAGHPVELLKDWPYDWNGRGYTTEEKIEIRSDRGGVRRDWALTHELGHAIGLDHSDPAFGPSVMIRSGNNAPAPRDYEAAACELGCGPCGADRYDIE